MALSESDSRNITYALGSSANLGRAKTIKESIKLFKDRFREPHVTPEKYREYKAASDKRQRTLKGSAGWFMRGPIKKGENRNRNSIEPSLIMTLDIDYATPEFVELLLAESILPGYFLIAHSTRSHTPENPRLRIMIFLEKAVSRERYQAASRIVAQLADPNMEWVDKVSFRPAQMMYMPTVSKDMAKHYIFYEQPGDFLDHEDIIDSWEMTNGSAEDIGNLPKTQGEDELRESAEFAEDPLEKKGQVGDFCRAYSITELVMGKDGQPGILADIYEPVEWANGVITRMTYLGGTTSNGAVVYDDKFIFSHHGSDPTAEVLINAFDAVRIHKFGNADSGEEKGTALKDLSSSKKMTEFLRDDPHYRVAQAESRYDLEEMLTDDDVDYDDELDEIDDEEQAELDDIMGVPVEATSSAKPRLRKSHRRNLAEKPPKRWIAKELSLTDDGIIRTTTHNIGTIVMNDPRLWRKIAYNEFSYQIVLTDDIKTKTKLIPTHICKDKHNGDRWQDYFNTICRAIIESPSDKGGYDIAVPMEKVRQGIELAARVNTFHPVRERILDHAENGEEGADISGVLCDYFGAEDNVYTREVSRLIMIASVARVFEPGCKFDTAVILEGGQGIGKSTAIKRLYGEEYFGEIDCDLGNKKEVAEQMFGKWALELPELSSMHKGEANHTKAFMTRQHDDVRLSYEKHTAELPRQSVIWGTTNDTEYLRDVTGGRRYFPIPVGDEPIDPLVIMRDQAGLWRAAYEAYVELRSRTPEGHDLPLYIKSGSKADLIAKQLQERARKSETWESWKSTLINWMDEEIPLRQFLNGNGGLTEDEVSQDHLAGVHMDTMVCRVAFTQVQLFREALGVNKNAPTGPQETTFWGQLTSSLKADGWEHGDKRPRIAGKQRRWFVRPDITEEERARGFRVSKPAQAQESGRQQVNDDDLI
ncbi:VapE domain-containing protein [Sulfitobacter sp. MOLA879]|uniref:VapE domain-containing protein n=1 Tax=Sulfitobacter sp. MOLA879 TaxID=3368579 RepID=UPI00374500AF